MRYSARIDSCDRTGSRESIGDPAGKIRGASPLDYEPLFIGNFAQQTETLLYTGQPNRQP